MTFCKKCGGQISEKLKFCDKCGALVEQSVDSYEHSPVNDLPDSYQEYVTESVQNENNITDNNSPVNSGKGRILDSMLSVIPEPLKKRGNNISLFIGVGSLAVVSIVYFMCFIFFMGDIATPMSYEAMGQDGANWFWMVAYFIINLSPALLTVYAFTKPSFRMISLCGAILYFTITIFSLVAWGLCDAGDFSEALILYGNARTGTFAWYVTMDCLAEAWYLKIPFSLCAVFGLGLDFIVNRKKK